MIIPEQVQIPVYTSHKSDFNVFPNVWMHIFNVEIFVNDPHVNV